MKSAAVILAVVATLAGAQASKVELDAETHHRLLLSGRPQVGLWKALLEEAKQKEAVAALSASGAQVPLLAGSSSKKPKYKAYCHEQPISHFDSSVNGTFCQRYWIDASAYKPGGPVFVLDGGETSGKNRLPFLENGILQILSNATEGLSIVLEHRYYGDSVPVKSLSTDDLRFLNNDEAMEDSAHFIEHFQPPKEILNLADGALHPKNTAWIYYGGSYAGARAAHMRTEYPHLVWGSIASSAVTHAQIVFPQYFDPIQEYAPTECIAALQESVKAIDIALSLPEPVPSTIKGYFGLKGLENDDFADVLHSPLGAWQGKNWDPKVGSDEFQNFCDALTGDGSAGSIGLVKISKEVMNYAKYIKEHVVARCPEDSSVEDCFGSHDDSKFLDTGLDQTWRLWLFQVCTQWGYFMPAPLEGPSILSKHMTLEHTSKICKQAYPPGKHFTVPAQPDVENINRRGDYAIAAPRLAFIDGDRDPWRPVTPGADHAPQRKSTVSQPVHLIYDGVHHYDENGLSNHTAEPARIRDVHQLEVNFVQEWVAEFKEHKKKAQMA